MTSSTLGEPETKDVPRRCSAQSHSAALSHLQPSCAGTNPVLLLPGLGGGSIPQPQTPASPTELPHHHPTAKPSSSPGCKSLYRHRCGSKISGAIPRVTPLKPFPRNLPGWKPSRSAAPAPLTSHTAHLLLFSLTPQPRACHGLPVPAHGQRHVGLATGKAGHISAWASCLFSRALFAGAEAVT